MTDLRAACRALLRTPWLTAVIVVSLGVGIGSNTVIFSWLRTVALNPLPAISNEPLALEARNAAGGYTGSSWLEYRDLRESLGDIATLLAHRPRSLVLGDNDSDERVWSELVSEDFFAALGVQPALGRFFRTDEVTQPGAAPVAVISDEFWRRKFSGRLDVIGQELRLNNRPFTIIGVTPPRFQGAFNGLGFDLWVPLTMVTELQPASPELTSRLSRGYALLMTPKPGVSLAHARTAVAAAAQSLTAAQPEANSGITFDLLPLWQAPRGGTLLTRAVATLQVFAALVLIVVCANTANLLLARATVRQKEIGIRLAVGAGASRIIRQLLTESILLGLAGATLGLVLALWGIDAVRTIPMPASVPVRLEPYLEWGGLLFALGLAVGCGVLFGLAPALQLARADVMPALRGGRGALSGRSRLRDFFVGAEVAVALVILVLAGLFLKSFHNSQRVSPGFNPQGVVLGSIDLAGRGYDEARGRTLVRELLARLDALPGVASAAVGGISLLDIRGTPRAIIEIESAPVEPERPRQTLFMHATPGYLPTMQIPFVAGGDLAPLDQENRPFDAVVNEELVRRYLPGSPAAVLGRRFKLGRGNFEITGVVRDGKYESLSEQPQPMAWLTLRSQFVFTPTLHVRARGADPLALLPEIRAVLRSLDPGLSLFDTRSLSQHIDNNLFLHRVPARMLSVLGPVALALAAIGLYAVLAYSLAQRTQEIGVRLTLGATPQSVVRLVMWDGLRVVLIGAAAGLAIAFGCGYYLQARLIEVPQGDPLIFAGVPLLLLAVAAAACWLPARKAAKVEPIIALRAE